MMHLLELKVNSSTLFIISRRASLFKKFCLSILPLCGLVQQLEQLAAPDWNSRPFWADFGVMKSGFLCISVALCCPAGEQGVGAEKAERQLKIDRGDRKIRNESDTVKKCEIDNAFCKLNFDLANNSSLKREFYQAYLQNQFCISK
jgi:hypothetical protein